MNIEVIDTPKEDKNVVVGETVIKKKRGRPRKYPIDHNKNKVKKKRGRPKGTKNKTTKKKIVKNKTRGRPKSINKLNKIYTIKKNISNIETGNVIIHLPIKTDDINNQNKNLFNYNPHLNIPKACNEEEYNNYSNYKLYSGNTDHVDHVDHTDHVDHVEHSDQVEGVVHIDQIYHSDRVDHTEPIVHTDHVNNPNIDTGTNRTNSTNSTNSKKPDNENYYKNYNYNIIHKHNWYKKTDLNSKNYIDRLKEYKKIRNNSIIRNTKNYSEVLLKEFSNINKWPEKTCINCWWCSHSFDSIPCSIPEKIINNNYLVYGIFCSPECAAAHLFNNNKIDNISEKFSLLNLLYKDIYSDNVIEQAYPKEVLRKFGGPLTIEEFRNNHIMDKKYKIVMPEIKVMIPKLELLDNIVKYSSKKYTINNYDNKIQTSETYIDKKVDSLYNKDTELILKRSTPFRKYTNTLEKCMNLKIK